MRVLYVHNSADIYGASRSLLRLLPEVSARGIEPCVVLPEEGPLRERVEGLGVEVVVEPGLTVINRANFQPVPLLGLAAGFPWSVGRIGRLVRAKRIDLVHTNTGVMPSPALAARILGVPHVWHVRDSFGEFRGLWKCYRRYITGLSAKVIAVSRAIAGQFDGALNVEVVHNGMPLGEFPEEIGEIRESFRRRHGLGSERVVGCVGRIKWVRKGQEVLVEAAALLRERGIKAKYLIVGAPSAGNEEHLDRLKGLIEGKGLVGDVILTGELTDARPAYAAMDIFVLPSVQPEPFGGVVLEAMAMKRPVIATAIGGSLDQVTEGQTGYLVPPGDFRALADKLSLLLGDRELCERMGEAGRARLKDCFSVEQMIAKFMGVYSGALK